MDVPLAIALLVGVFYIFNIEYTPGVRGVFAFLEGIMLSRTQLAKTRIAVQKLIKDVGACTVPLAYILTGDTRIIRV